MTDYDDLMDGLVNTTVRLARTEADDQASFLLAEHERRVDEGTRWTTRRELFVQSCNEERYTRQRARTRMARRATRKAR